MARSRKVRPMGLCEGGCGRYLPRELANVYVSQYDEPSVPGLWCPACVNVEKACLSHRVADIRELAGLRDRADAYLARVSDVLRRSGVEDAERLIVPLAQMVGRDRDSWIFAPWLLAHRCETPSEALAMHVAEQAVTGGQADGEAA